MHRQISRPLPVSGQILIKVVAAGLNPVDFKMRRNEQPDLVVLDLMLPGEDGLSICRRVRPFFNGPIIMLTAKGDEVDRIIGLEMGADDYLPKPFNPRELLARAKAVLRRRSSEAPGAPSKDIQIIEFGEYKLNLATREMIAGWRAEREGIRRSRETGRGQCLEILSLILEEILDL